MISPEHAAELERVARGIAEFRTADPDEALARLLEASRIDAEAMAEGFRHAGRRLALRASLVSDDPALD